MTEQKRRAKEFVKTYALCRDNLTPEYLIGILRKMGFTIYRHNKNGRSAECTEMVLDVLHLNEYAKARNGFTYISETDRIVFLHEQLSDNEAVCVLLHEFGHILCNHVVKLQLSPFNDAVYEQQAGEFVMYVMQFTSRKTSLVSILYKSSAVFIFICTVLSICKGFLFPMHIDTIQAPSPSPSVFVSAKQENIAAPSASSQNSLSQNENIQNQVYVAKTGTVYHVADCHYIKGRAGVRIMAIADADALGLPPCSYCKPEK